MAIIGGSLCHNDGFGHIFSVDKPILSWARWNVIGLASMLWFLSSGNVGSTRTLPLELWYLIPLTISYGASVLLPSPFFTKQERRIFIVIGCVVPAGGVLFEANFCFVQVWDALSVITLLFGGCNLAFIYLTYRLE